MLKPKVELVEIAPDNRGQRGDFVDLPFRLAQAHPSWQPGLRRLSSELLDPERYPFWSRHPASFFLAVRGGEVAGRICVVDPGPIPEHPTAAVIAFPDFADDPLVVDRLFDAAEARAKARGATELIGPMNPDIHHDVGIQIEGAELRNKAFMGYQPTYYSAHFERRGYSGLADFEAWGLYRDHFRADGRLRRLRDRVERNPSFRVRPIDMSRYAEELELFRHLYGEAFSDHWGFTAPDRDQFEFIAGDMKHILRAEMALVAEWADKPVGFVLGIPDFYQILPMRTGGRLTVGLIAQLLWRWRKIDEARVMIAGVLPEYRSKGVHLPLFYRIAEGIFDLGYRGGEISWVHRENDPMARALPLLGAYRTKTYRLYHKRLHQ